MQNVKQKVMVIVGPTSSGKSAAAVRLARALGGEVISADSRQVYKGLNIGTGKITRREMRGVPHHLLDVASPRKRYSVARYVKEARRAIAAIARRGKLPIMVGGTGHYIDAALDRVFIPEAPPNATLRRRLEKKTPEELFAALRALDSRRAKNIDRHNSRRLIRAVEVAKALGRVPSHSNIPRNVGMFEALFIGLKLPSDALKRKIARRLNARMRKGMIEEARRLHAMGLSWKRMEELGLEYRYLSRRLRMKMSKTDMLRKLNAEVCRYAKRQMTWFKKNKSIRWFHPADASAISAAVRNRLS